MNLLTGFSQELLSQGSHAHFSTIIFDRFYRQFSNAVVTIAT